MSEFRTSRQRRPRSNAGNQNNKNAYKYVRHTPQPVESEEHGHRSVIDDDRKIEPNETMDINGNLHPYFLPAHEERKSAIRSKVSSTESTDLPNQGNNFTNGTMSKGRSGCHTTSIKPIPLTGVGEIQENIGNDATYQLNPCYAPPEPSASDTPKILNDLHHNKTTHEPAVVNNARRNLSSPFTGQTQSEFRSRSQRKPANSQHPGVNAMQRDISSKRHGGSVDSKTGANKRRHVSPGIQPFRDVPFVNVPANHLFQPSTFPFVSQMPHIFIEQQRLPKWNIGCEQHSFFPLHHLAHGSFQAGRQFRDRNFGNNVKEKYSRDSNEDEPGNKHRFQNRFRTRKHHSLERTGVSAQQCKIPNGAHSKPDGTRHMQDVRIKGTAGSLRYSDTSGAFISESGKHTLTSSKDGEGIINQTTYTKHGDINSQVKGSGVADMKHRILKAFLVDSNKTDSRAKLPSQIMAPQTLSASREYPNSCSSNEAVHQYNSGVHGCISAGIMKKSIGLCRTECFDVEAKHACSWGLGQPTVVKNHTLCTREKVQCETLSPENIYPDLFKSSDLQILPPYFDPTVHPLQVFRNGQSSDHNLRWLQVTEKPCSEYMPGSCFIPQNPNVSDGSNNSAAYNSSAEHQVYSNAIVSNTVKETAIHSTRYSGNSRMLSKDTISTMNTSVKDMTNACSSTKEAHSLHPGKGVFSLTMNDEIVEELKRAQHMRIPVKLTSEGYPASDSHLNPNANEFSPKLTDCNGNQFTVTRQNGVSYFKRDLGNSSLDNQTESNISYEHEAGEVLASTANNILKTYPTDTHVVPKEGVSAIFPTHEQQTSEDYRTDHQLYNGYCKASSDVYCFNIPQTYNSDTQLQEQHIPGNIPGNIPGPTVAANGEMHTDNYFDSNNNYYFGTSSQIFTPFQSQGNHSRNALSSSEVHMHAQSLYANLGYTVCSFVPMYLTEMPFSGHEYGPLLMQTPVVSGVPFAVSVPAHLPSQTHPSVNSAPEKIQMTSPTQNYSFQAPVFNLQAYYEAMQNNSTDPSMSDNAVLSTDLPNTVITHIIRSSASNAEANPEQNIHSEATPPEDVDRAAFSKTCRMRLNIALSASSSIHHTNLDNIYLASEYTQGIASDGTQGIASDGTQGIASAE
ncbi:hypothetical protein BsWGS_10340 [Bradybaena similaris]